MTFSFGNENDPDNIPPEIIESMFKDYGDFTGIEFISGDRKRGEEAYFEDIVFMEIYHILHLNNHLLQLVFL